ncbi:MAG: DUF6810 family protein [Chloroflexota bacterium]|nr:DUF6810 family protein [Chloroflexota bacterium]|tara:strand:+ start:2651 stop:3205 length:555 start_codon:yes stop_codon:yes gene_type:complete
MKKILLPIALLLIVYGCRSEPYDELVDHITDIPDIYSIEDFKKSGLKIGEKYDNKDLPNSLSIYWGFWKDDDADEGSARFQSLGGSVGGMRDFEIRFYPSHSDAVNYGSKYAKNATGPDAVLTKKESLWAEGIKNRRTSGGPDGSPLPKYGGYVIYGNFILLCEGISFDQSLQTCSNLIRNLDQ